MKFGIIPSVTFIVDIPEDVKESWYDRRVFVGMKEALFATLSHDQVSSPSEVTTQHPRQATTVYLQ